MLYNDFCILQFSWIHGISTLHYPLSYNSPHLYLMPLTDFFRTNKTVCIYCLLQKQKNSDPNEYNVALKVDKLSEVVSAMDRRIQSLTDHSMKLERMILHFSHEQERYWEPEKQEQLHRVRRCSDSTWESRNCHYRQGDHP